MMERVRFGYQKVGARRPWFWFIYICSHRDCSPAGIGASCCGMASLHNLRTQKCFTCPKQRPVKCLEGQRVRAPPSSNAGQPSAVGSSVAMRTCHLPPSAAEARARETVTRLVFAAVSQTYLHGTVSSCCSSVPEVENLWISVAKRRAASGRVAVPCPKSAGDRVLVGRGSMMTVWTLMAEVWDCTGRSYSSGQRENRELKGKRILGGHECEQCQKRAKGPWVCCWQAKFPPVSVSMKR